MSDLLKSLGAFITKPNVANASKKVATPDDEKYKEISERNLNKVAKHYSDMVTPDIMYALMGIHDYRCLLQVIQWCFFCEKSLSKKVKSHSKPL